MSSPNRSHISSSCEDDQVYVHAISDARCVFDMGVSNVQKHSVLWSSPLFWLHINTSLSVSGGNWLQHENPGHWRRL